ncbi:aspartate aminotransferase family protein [Streptomyces iconiensis]|uniref:alanine--glyoxylate transaminase n=1 Tax=Streptomyces iconiensis TaxID=1384038 RepID=A0ABT6ZYU1_9ACTN|nr:aspartate aminotransferase family protein [Streptomyces iconiensis]MDJ1134220.1 aspartate aminotransferase family protein [Streptomyces iconiensis]
MLRKDELPSRHRAVAPGWSPLYYRGDPLEILSGHGRYVRDAQGRSYLDLYGGIGANLLGYDVPEVRQALERQLRTGVVHTSTFYLSRSHVELAERVGRLSGVPDPVVFFTCSGTEAVETALLLATEYRRSRQVVALHHGYHGRSFGALAVTGDRRWQGMALSPLNVAHVPAGRADPQGAAQEDTAAYVRRCAAELEGLLDGVLPPVAALLAEPVQGVAGAVPLEPGQLAAYGRAARERGVLLIVDEMQTGWGRTGRYWGHQWAEAQPDLLVFGKGVGNGLALGGVVGRREVMSCLPMPSVSTFGGNPLATTAAAATLDVLEERDLPRYAHRIGGLLRSRLDGRLRETASARSVQGWGLLLGLAFVDPDTGAPSPARAAAVQEECRARGVLVGLGGTAGNRLRLMPPLTLTEEEARHGADVIAAAAQETDGCGRST